MASRNTLLPVRGSCLRRSRRLWRLASNGASPGFTLIEMLIAIGILAVIFGLALFISFDFYKSYAFRSEKNVIVSVLQKARSQSLNNINQVHHGVHFEDSPLKYIIFECPLLPSPCDYVSSSTDIVIDPSYGISITSPTLPFDVVFDQLSGASSDRTITVSYGGKSYDININSEGQINW